MTIGNWPYQFDKVMKAWLGLMEDTAAILDRNTTHELERFKLQKTLTQMLAEMEPSDQGSRLIERLFCYFGFGLLLFLKPYYSKLTAAHAQTHRQTLRWFDSMAISIIGNYKTFPELQFLSYATRSEGKERRKSAKDLSFKDTVSSQVFERSMQFRDHVLEMKKINLRLQKIKLDMQTLKEVKQQFIFNEDIRTLEKKIYININYFEREYHRNLLLNLLKTLQTPMEKVKPTGMVKMHLDGIINTIFEAASNRSPLKVYNFEESKKQLAPQISRSPKNKVFIQEDKRNYSPPLRQIKGEKYEEITPIKNNPKHNQSQAQIIKSTSIIINKQPTEEPFDPDRLCCRPFFYESEVINVAESSHREYKNYTIPLKTNHYELLKKAIVGFLNASGGIIYLGIKEEENRQRKVASIFLNEAKKQDFLFVFRQMIIECIEPEIIANKLYAVKFVPIRHQKTNLILPGRYIIKIIIEMGSPTELYSYNGAQGVCLAFRTENEVLSKDPKKDFRKIYQIIKNRLLEKPRIAEKEHEGKCMEPEVGLPCYSTEPKS